MWPWRLDAQPGALAMRAAAAFAVWTLTLMAVVLVGGSGLEIAIFSSGALLLFVLIARSSRLLAQAGGSRDQGCTDPVTELHTAHFADHFLAMEFAAAQRGRQVTVVLFGFDAFEEFVARQGRARADAAVREFGSVLRRLTRRMNLSARYGWRGDTFLSVLSDAGAPGAAVYVERVLEAVRHSAARMPMPAVSAGVVEFEGCMSAPQDFAQAAEEALAAARAGEGTSVHIRRARREPQPEGRFLHAL
ncbi:MAG TPA: diguanylate cyclase [Longimicrobiales bacterium]|nr:diguanylate cyclase [Longimicrobiales bacterium]